jgi:hypothetical protein
MRYISLDASTTAIGWSIFDEDNLVAYGKIKPDDEKAQWRERIINLIPKVNKLLSEYKPEIAYVEDVPLIDKKSKLTLVQLGAVQGMLLGVLCSFNIETHFIYVSTWRKNIGLHDGTRKGMERENLKPNSIKLANKLFNLDLKCVYSKTGKYQEKKSDDDISDSILIFASTREKHRMKK